MNDIGKSALAEFIATFALIFIGASAGVLSGQVAGVLGVALAHGLVLAIMVSITAHISGGHVNPAVTIGVWVGGKISSAKALVYIGSQVAGGIFGALMVRAVMPGLVYSAAHGGAPALGARTPTGTGVLVEAILTFFLVFAVYGTAVDKRGPLAKTAGLTIGLVLTFDILAGAPLTGAAMNPARAFGPELAAGFWTDWWVYWVGPILGGVIAAGVYSLAFLREGEDE